jgi:hypothetical protein
MNRTLKIFLIVGFSGLLLLAVALMAFYKFVDTHKDEWLNKGRDTLQEGMAAGKNIDDAECLKQALKQHRDGKAGVGGLGARLWIKGCLQTATPTQDFCRDVPKPTDITGTMRWPIEICAKHGLSTYSYCSGTVAEVQIHCETRNSTS